MVCAIMMKFFCSLRSQTFFFHGLTTPKMLPPPLHMVEIQEIVDSIEVPSNIARIPAKIASGFADYCRPVEELDSCV